MLTSVAVVTPMQGEMAPIRDALTRAGFDSLGEMAGRLPVTRFPSLGLTLAVGGTGKAQFGVQVQHLLNTGPDQDLVICAGAAGALVDGMSVGDLVIGTRTIEHDYVNRFSDRPLPSFDGDPAAIQSLRDVCEPTNGCGVSFGLIASGDEDVVGLARRDEIRDLTGARVVAWEGAGGARACQFSEVPYLEIRCVTDSADQDAPDDFQANLRMAMENVADLLARWLNGGSNGP